MSPADFKSSDKSLHPVSEANGKVSQLQTGLGSAQETRFDCFTRLLLILLASRILMTGLAGEDPQLAVRTGLHRLQERLATVAGPRGDVYADADLYRKGVEWALRYESRFSSNDFALLSRSLERGNQRVDALLFQRRPWTDKKGRLIRGFVSRVDGSTQCYGVIVPRSYDGFRPMRLDVVLHGSSKPVGLSELRFGARFDEGDVEKEAAPDTDYLELHPLGRVENCYRWAGETDVFEAIEAVCRNYRVDRDRIVLRGMSMGASGTWHLGLKHADRFTALGPYCGYVDTHRFSETPIPGFIRVGALPAHQELGLHLLDSIDYAANASMVAAIGAIGDQDVFFQSHVHMREAMQREGLEMVNLISPGTGHVIDPVTFQEQMRRIGNVARLGLEHFPSEIRWVTWSLKYNRCHWVELLSLDSHYARAEIVARIANDGVVEVELARNISRFALQPPLPAGTEPRVRIEGVEIPVPAGLYRGGEDRLIFGKGRYGWSLMGGKKSLQLRGKQPGLQGPIDDAFTTPFVCVQGTGRPWNPEVVAWADASLRRFAHEWAKYMRGDLPTKKDTEVTEEDLRSRNLILFGDPGSNFWIRRSLKHLPLRWTPRSLELGGKQYASRQFAPALICESPLPGAESRYVVINSGHTFHEAEFAAFNYLLFPRHGDWAVLKMGEGTATWKPGASELPESTEASGFFDENWKWNEKSSP